MSELKWNRKSLRSSWYVSVSLIVCSQTSAILSFLQRLGDHLSLSLYNSSMMMMIATQVMRNSIISFCMSSFANFNSASTISFTP